MTEKIEQFLAREQPATPCLVVDLDRVVANYAHLSALAPWGEAFYAVKANPAPRVLERLAAAGASFDAASPAEITACVAAGVAPARISYGHPVKKAGDIAFAAAKGIDLFAFDSDGEIAKLAANAPGSSVVCRIAVSNDGASWPLTRKFGCASADAVTLLGRARSAGLNPVGLSFHVGSQQTEPARWCEAVAECAGLFAAAAGEGMSLELINIGGGFPIPYGAADIPELGTVFDAIGTALADGFGAAMPRVLIEPGRAIVATAGIIRSEVVLVADRSYESDERWIYLDVGRYGGLAESEGEAIRYPIAAATREGPLAPAVIAGPTCDSHDVLYQNAKRNLPLDLAVGDHVHLFDAGAYTTSYASIGFNGFAPLEEHFV